MLIPPPTPWYDPKSVPFFSRALWLVGHTGAGKSTFANTLVTTGYAECLLEAGETVRKMHGPEATVEQFTATTLDCLDKDPRFFAKKIEARIEELEDCRVVVVGARNPVDVAACFDPKQDAMMLLSSGGNYATPFEKTGIQAILALMRFWQAIDVISTEQFVARIAPEKR